MKENFIFFLGGYDLEMKTISEILEEQRCAIYDHKLTWGAKASNYKKEIENLKTGQIPVLVELEIDFELPASTIVIDHHNEKSGANAKTSIEQIASLLKINLTRKQQLISANDKAYIDGMLELNATQSEIEEIRKLDRRHQGVTKEDEELGMISISHNLNELDDDTVLIYSLTEKTSAITDSIYMYYRHIFIITPLNEFSYFGSGEMVEKLICLFTKMKHNNGKVHFWSGGNLPFKGFFGSNTSLKKKEIMELCNLMDGKRIHSQHIFLFPFTIESEKLQFSKNATSQERLEIIHNRLKETEWKYKPFKISHIDIGNDEHKKYFDAEKKRVLPYQEDEIWAYNEHNYFYEFIHKAIYTEIPKGELFNGKGNQDQPVSLFYERKCFHKDEITYYIKDEVPVHYTLKVDHVSLRIFETGIGILSLTLYNTCYADFDAVLKINDYGRRIYPQFLGIPKENETPIDATKGSFFPDKIVFNACGLKCSQEFKTEDFFNRPNQYAAYIQMLLQPLNTDKYKCKPVIDDRMFTICWHENEIIMNMLKEPLGEYYCFENSDDWYKYIFLDSGKSPLIQNKKFKKKLIQKVTYPRFTDWGTLFGITRYSFMCLCGKNPQLDNDRRYRVIRNHMQKMYYQMCVLLLAQRASIVQFNNELEEALLEVVDTEEEEKINKAVNSKKNKSKDEKNSKSNVVSINRYEFLLKKVKKLENLDSHVINFINRMTFEEITPQEQGIELYQLALNNMQIPKQLTSLRQGITDMHLTSDQILERLNLDEEKKRNEIQRERKKLFDKITLIAAIFAPLTLYSTLAKYIKQFIFLPPYLNSGILLSIYHPLWSIVFLLTLFILFYCLINDDYSEDLGYEANWFSPLKALTQQFFAPKSKPELYMWKKMLLAFSSLLFVLTLPTFLNIFSNLLFYLRFTWQLLQ